MAKRTDSQVAATALAAAWRRGDRRRRAEADQRRRTLRQSQREQRAKLVAVLQDDAWAFTKAQRRTVLRQYDLVERREQRDLDAEMRQERTQAARADYEPMVAASWEKEWEQLVRDRRATPERLIRLLAEDDGLSLLASADTRAAVERIRQHGTRKQKRQLRNAVSGIRPGRPKRVDRRDALMRRMKTKVQTALIRIRRDLRRAGQIDQRAYARRIEQDVLVPLLWPADKRLGVLSKISDPNTKPVDAAVTIVVATFGARASVVRRLGRAALTPEKKPQGIGRPRKTITAHTHDLSYDVRTRRNRNKQPA